jgi:histidine ammonia-lyase
LSRRFMTALRSHGFAVGRAGVSPGIVRAYAGMLNAGVLPVMPLTGSVGEADLAPLAHVAGVLAGAGMAGFGGEMLLAPEALRRAGLEVPPFGLKDGLALVSSNACSAGLGALAVADAERLAGAWLAACALSFEAWRGNLAPLHPDAVALRPAPGEAGVAAALRALLAGGELDRPGASRRLQDPLSLRCAAPVLAACLTALGRATEAVALELNSSDDNPAVLEDRVQPNAAFDSTHLVLAFETLGLAGARVAAAQGSRILKLMSAASSGLPRFLSPVQEGRSGLAPLQKTAAALVAEIGHGAAPMPALVLAAADGVEDYATMAVSAVRNTANLLARLRLLCAVELLVAAQACDLRGGVRLAPGAAAVHAAVRGCVPMLWEDRPVAPDLQALDALIASGQFDGCATGLFA